MTLARDRPAGSAGTPLVSKPRARNSGQHRAPRNSQPSVLTDIALARPTKTGDPRITRLVVLVWLVVFFVLCANASGRIFFDTKLGVDIAPADFLVRLWQPWNPNEWFGTLQDQYIGYAFPMGPFYLICEWLQIPIWVTERLWLSLLVAVGFGGIVKLAAELKIGTERSRVVAGLAFALWPTFTIVIGSTSAGLLPGLLAPWAVLPLVRAARGGRVMTAAAKSGVAVLCMGGVNATSTLDALILPGLFILTEARGRRLMALAISWAGAVVLATSWWVGPLLLQAKYSYNFLPYVEQSATTTGAMSAATFLRGAGNWTAYLNLGQPWLSAGWVMVTNPAAIMAGAITAGAGLLGLARRDIPYAGWLKLSLGVTALIALAGYPGSLGGVFHHPVDQMLDGVLAPLRSVYKVEPAVAVVLALGIAHALVLRARRPAIVGDPAPRILWHVIATSMIVLVLVGLAFPYLSGQLLSPGSFTAVPKYWYRVSAFIRQHSPRAPVLVAPAAAHGVYVWGETVDEPLEPLATSPWVEQGLVPFGGAGSQLLLSSLEAAISSGERTPGLAATLARSGIRYVVVRNDLNPLTLGYTSPQLVEQALISSGFTRVAAFGPVISAAQAEVGSGLVGYALPSYRAVEVFEPSSAAGTAVPPPAVALPVSQTVLVNGGPDALLQLTGQHVLGTEPAVIAGDKLVTAPALWAVTDTLPRADHAFGNVDPVPSYTYTRTETNPPEDPLGGASGPPRQLLPVPSAGHQTVAVLSGAASVTASSSGSWLAETPQIDPVNAFDGNPSTYWAEASPSTPVGQWIQITFSRPITLPGSVGIRLLVSGSLRPVANRLTVSTAQGTVTSGVRRTGAVQPLPVVPGRTRTLRITIAGARGGIPGGPGAGISDVEIPGVTVARYALPAEDPAGRLASDVAFSFHRQVPSPASLADLAAYPPMARMVPVRSQTMFQVTGSAIAVPGRKLDVLLARLAPAPKNTLQVTASSTLGSLPALGPSNLFKPGQPSSWIAGAGNPVLRLRWQGKRTIRRMVILPLQGFGAAPESIKITSPDGVRYASIGLDGLTEIVPPLGTDRMTISFPVVQYTTTVQPGTGQVVQLPVGLSKLSIPALRGLRATSPAPSAKFTLACGAGPKIMIDGRSYATATSGTFGDLTQFLPVRIRLCTPGAEVTLTAGRHRLLAARPGAFTITDLSLVSAFGPASSPGRPAGRHREVRILSWGPDLRKVSIGPGAAAYLELHQNANPGWVATMHGRALTAVRLDGWQQGFVVPAGAGGVISMTFNPAKFYHAWIILSAAAAIVLLLIAFSPRRRRRVHNQMDRDAARSAPPGLPSGEAGEPANVPVPVPSPVPVLAARAWAPVPVLTGLIALGVLMLIIGGPVVAVVPLIACIAYRWPNRYGALALAAMIASGLIAAAAAHRAVPGSGAFSGTAQAFALIALAAALVPAWPGRPPGTGRRLRPRLPRLRARSFTVPRWPLRLDGRVGRG